MRDRSDARERARTGGSSAMTEDSNDAVARTIAPRAADTMCDGGGGGGGGGGRGGARWPLEMAWDCEHALSGRSACLESAEAGRRRHTCATRRGIIELAPFSVYTDLGAVTRGHLACVEHSPHEVSIEEMMGLAARASAACALTRALETKLADDDDAAAAARVARFGPQGVIRLFRPAGDRELATAGGRLGARATSRARPASARTSSRASAP